MYGLCKLLGIKAPNRNKVLKYCEDLFMIIDDDDSGEINFEEFSSWIKQDNDLQMFLLKFTGK